MFDLFTRQIEVWLHLLETTWVGSVVEAIIGKAVVGAALVGCLRFSKSIEIKWQAIFRGRGKPAPTAPPLDAAFEFPADHPRNVRPAEMAHDN